MHHMRPKITAIIFVLMGLVATLALLAQGTVGPASIVHKEVAERVGNSAARINAVVVAKSEVLPRSIELPWRREAKITIKQIYWWLTVGYGIPEYGEEYILRNERNVEDVRCLVRVFGDHVVGITIVRNLSDTAFSNSLMAALLKEFPGYIFLEKQHA
ncbi:hypothetical protein ACQE3E_23970 (plasmid) [Methylomonas sp. MED-D]|uniref:hypothetical protein n=1 Tax=Methylomonas sp. MED-D TaxID=3418768 RepID=UPI003CFD26B9